MSTGLMILVIIASIVLIGNVLMQEDKTGGLSGSIGGGTNDSAWSKNQGRSYESISDKIVILAAIVIAVAIVVSLAIK